jgi:hypothetical protein
MGLAARRALWGYHSYPGKFHDQGDAKWKEITRSLWRHNDTPCGWPAPGWPIGCLGSGRLQGVMGGLGIINVLVILISNIIF